MHPQYEGYWGKVNPIGSRSCYDEGKRCAGTLFFGYWRQHQLQIKVVRIFNTYGPRMHPNDGRVVSNFIVQALKGEDINIYGDGQQTRSFCFVDDLIEAMLCMMNTGSEVTGPVNIGNPGEFIMLELAETVIRLTKSNSTLVFLPLPQDDPKQRRPDISLAKQALGWTPKVGLEVGLTLGDAIHWALKEASDRQGRSMEKVIEDGLICGGSSLSHAPQSWSRRLKPTGD